MYDLKGNMLANRYFLKRLAGAGAMGQVYQAWDQKRGTYMAVKTIRERRFVQSFIRETQALVKLTHPNIIRFYDVDVDEKAGVIFIVMDWVEGKDLQNLLKKRRSPLGVGEVAHILEGVQKALFYAHDAKIMHCDIKPANILLRDADNQVLLSDFGLAHAAHDTSGGGTLAFMAPELFSGAINSVSTDIYALGVTLYQLLSNQLPFLGNTRERLIYEHRNKIPPQMEGFNSRLPSGLSAVIEKALSKDPRQRHKSVTELWMEFSKYAQGDREGISWHSSDLYGIRGEMASQKIKISGKGLTVGRNKKNKLRLKHPSISRYHAVIIWEQGKFFIRDNGSAVETYINGRRLEPNRKEKLRSRDKIRIGVADTFEFRDNKSSE